MMQDRCTLRSFVVPAMTLLVTVGAAVRMVRAEDPVFCELYAPGHFGNWYEVAGEREMRAVLAEAKAWGYNRYGDWFDALDCVDPFSGDRQYSLGNALWDRKREHFRTAQSLGLQTDLIITPNHVYRDQLKSEWLASGGGRVFGQLICPSKPAARETILENHRKLLADLAAAGVHLDSITAAPYDFGGCNCDECKPWIVTFAKLACDIYHLGRTDHPDLKLRFIGWWWSAEEHRLFADWMDLNAPNLASSLALHIPYGETSVGDVRLPEACERHAFVHIGYGEQAQPRDVYGRTGPVMAPQRIERTVRDLKSQSVKGVIAYSEGISDDVNKALLAGLFSGTYPSSGKVLKTYAGRYFQADEKQADAWSAWLAAWGRPFERDAVVAKQAMSQLCGDPDDWRRRQWELKADMFIAHQAIGTGDQWPRERLAHAEAFWSAWETLQRGVYGVGPLRHSLGRKYIDLPWHKSWMEQRYKVSTQPASP